MQQSYYVWACFETSDTGPAVLIALSWWESDIAKHCHSVNESVMGIWDKQKHKQLSCKWAKSVHEADLWNNWALLCIIFPLGLLAIGCITHYQELQTQFHMYCGKNVPWKQKAIYTRFHLSFSDCSSLFQSSLPAFHPRWQSLALTRVLDSLITILLIHSGNHSDEFWAPHDHCSIAAAVVLHNWPGCRGDHGFPLKWFSYKVSALANLSWHITSSAPRFLFPILSSSWKIHISAC